MRQRPKILLSSFIVLAISLFMAHNSFAQVRQEVEEKTLEPKRLVKGPAAYNLSQSAALFFGYDSNPGLTPLRKGDTFEEALYSLSFRKMLVKNLRFFFDYDLDVLNYDTFTDISNALNHVRFGVDRKMGRFTLGTGYDLGVASYFHDEEGDFYFNKGFIFIREQLTKKIYHGLLFEAGAKQHTTRKALADTITTYQNKELLDHRQAVEYRLGAALTKKLSLKFRTKFSVNDSNARYLDFYDYKSYLFSTTLDYKLTDAWGLETGYSFLKKDYKDRTLLDGTGKQRDQIHAATFGVHYKVNKNNIVTVLYTYRNNDSNEDIEKYMENVVSCGWQYNF